MKKEYKDSWVSALRSGKYKQGHFSLRNPADESYCCLGVLCDVVDPDSWRYESGRYIHRDHHISYVPDEIANIVGLPDRNPLITYNGEATSLTRLNDTLGLSFEEIADLVEAQL